MNTRTRQTSFRAVKQRVEAGLEAHRVEPASHVARRMQARFGLNPRHCASPARLDKSRGDLSACAPLKALLDQPNDLVPHLTCMRKAQRFVSLARATCNVSTQKVAERDKRFPPTFLYPYNQGLKATRSSA